MKLGVVMPVGLGRNENVMRVMQSLAQLTPPDLAHPLDNGIDDVVCVCDGFTAEQLLELQEMFTEGGAVWPFRIHLRNTPKHEPGMEQPRNIGVRILKKVAPATDHVWFVDSDVIVEHGALNAYLNACARAGEDCILVGPYDWMAPGQRDPQHDLHNDPRWPSFNQHDPEEVIREDLSAGLACFSGNLVWPIDRFVEVGGFWSEIHHGRCEDGELGLRAVALGVPISFVRAARGWHLWHPVNIELAQQRNARDVPMLNERHPWVQGRGLEMVDEDGRRFNVRCAICGESINTLEWWHHAETCGRQT